MKTNYLKDFIGRKGGGQPPQPTQTPDNLRSKDTMEIILGLGEGPWYGLRNGAKDFFVGDTALQNSSGEYNFKTFVMNFFPGVDNPANIKPVLGGQSSNSAVNLSLVYNVPVTRQTSTRGIDSIELRFVWNRLLETNQNGTFPATAEFRIEYKKTTDVIWRKAYDKDLKISGKTTSTYAKEFRIILESTEDADWDIRITKLSVEDTEEYFNAMVWESFQEVIQDPISYPNTAVLQLSGETNDQFSSIPQWSGIYKGLLVQVPSNYDPETREYDGAWDGTFQIAWTDNPAWCLYDFVMNDRYGIRSYYQSINLDKYDVYEAGQWCDEQVPDGKGGTQPRYTFNTLLSEARSGKELARYIAGSFNATFFDDLNGKAYLRVDKDDSATAIFTKENVHEDGFDYSYTDITTRYNDITVTFINPELNWSEDRRRIFSQEYIDKFGRIPYDYIAVGCIDSHEALRRSWNKLITANTETCIVSFKTNRIAEVIKPFDVILICDPDMGYGVSGRIKSLNEDRDVITLRTPIYLEVGVTYYITVTLDDGSKVIGNLTNVSPGYNSTLYLADGLPENLADKAVFTLEAEGVIGLPRPFRVLKIEELDGSPDAFNIEAISINRNNWYDSDNITDSGTIKYSALPDPFDPPGPVTCSFDETFVKSTLQFHLIVSPYFNRGAYKYYTNDHSFEVWSRPSGSSLEFTKRTLYYGDTLIDHPPGLYDFKILGISYLGKKTRIDTAPIYQFNVSNPKDPPADIDWIKINRREVYWGYSNPPDDFEGFEVRYQNEEGRTTWDDAGRPHQGLLSNTSFYTQLIPPSARVIMVRAVDAFGIYSNNSAIIYRDAIDLRATNEVDRTSYHTALWPGTKTGCSISGTNLLANDTGTNMYSGVSTAYMYDGGGMYEAVYTDMYYEDDFVVTHKGDLLVEIDFEGSGYEVYYKLKTDSIWLPISERQELEIGEYDVKLKVFGGPTRGRVNSFNVVIDAPDIVEEFQDLVITSGSAGIRLPITKKYSTIKRIFVSIQDTGSSTAIGYKVIDKSTTIGAGPLIKLVDAAGAYTTGTFDADVKGYD